MIGAEKSSYMMPSRPPVLTGIFLITARVLRSNIVTVESPPLVMNPRPDLGDKAMPWVRGVSGMSPTTLPVGPSTTITWVLRDTNTRPVPGSAVRESVPPSPPIENFAVLNVCAGVTRGNARVAVMRKAAVAKECLVIESSVEAVDRSSSARVPFEHLFQRSSVDDLVRRNAQQGRERRRD